MSDSKKISYLTDGRSTLPMTAVLKEILEKGRGPAAMTPIPNSAPEERGRGPVATTPVPTNSDQPATPPTVPASDSAVQPAQSDQGDSK